MTWYTRTIQLHLSTCKGCGSTFQDTDAERLGHEMDAHERECRA